MKHLTKGLLIIITSLVSLQLHAFTSDIITIKFNDGETITTRLCLPELGETDRIVVAVNGTGPYTYLTQRDGFNYYDVLAENVPFESTLDLQDRFKVCGKVNLKVFLFDHHNHDLNIEEKILSGKFSEGLQKLFDTTVEI